MLIDDIRLGESAELEFKRVPNDAPEVVRELVVNAAVHRTYVDGASSPVSVALCDDRLEVTSPGGLPRGMTVAKMLDRQLSALKAKGVLERKGGTRGVWRVAV